MAVKFICSTIEVLRMNVCYCPLSITEVLAHKNSGLNIWDKAVLALFNPIFFYEVSLLFIANDRTLLAYVKGASTKARDVFTVSFCSHCASSRFSYSTNVRM